MEIALSPEIATACFRIVQEALTKNFRHTQLQKVSFPLQQHDRKLNLTIRDDRIEFDVAAAKQRASLGKRLGLFGMEEQERLEKLSPGLVLMDLAMLKMNGLKATRSIEAELSDRRVVILNLNDSVVYRYKAQSVGRNSFMAKIKFATSLLLSIHSIFARIACENHQV